MSTAKNPLRAQVGRDVTPIVALDVPSETRALSLVDALGDRCDFYKVGPELFIDTGPRIVSALVDRGCRVFVDLKLHDIPNTVRGGCRAAARAGARLLTVHAVGGKDMLEAAVTGSGEGAGDGRCDVLAVTVLTSLDAARLGANWDRRDVDVSREVMRLAEVARDAGTAGVVCSGGEAARVRDAFGNAFGILVPGVRLAGSALNDQQRATTAADAAAAGADYIVVGRTVTAATDVRAAMDQVLQELAGGF